MLNKWYGGLGLPYYICNAGISLNQSRLGPSVLPDQPLHDRHRTGAVTASEDGVVVEVVVPRVHQHLYKTVFQRNR